VTHSFLFPDGAQGDDEGVPRKPRDHTSADSLQAIMSAGEAVGDAVFAYCRQRAGRDGQRDVRPDRDQLHRRQLLHDMATRRAPPEGAEAGWPRRRPAPGSMGKAYPGHRVAVIDDEGHECPVRCAGRRGGEPL
jgi:acetyl-CoA synthetase